MFHELVEQKPKTDVYDVYSKHHITYLGTVKWYAPWRQYCFYPSEETVWSRSCLKEIIEFTQILMDERKNKK